MSHTFFRNHRLRFLNMTTAADKTRLHPALSRSASFVLGCALFFASPARAADFAFSNSMAQAALAEQRGDVPSALKIYGQAESLASTNAVNLCVLSRRYCDLIYLTKTAAAQKELAERALACALQAANADPQNATAHACVAVCYAQNCAYADLKTELAYSRLFKLEAEKTIALDPQQDIAYYLLGRWHYEVANVGLLSRAYVKVVYGGLPKASNEDAIRQFQKAIALAPNRIIHHAGLATVYEATGERNRQIHELEQCRDLKAFDPADAEAQRAAEKKLAALRK